MFAHFCCFNKSKLRAHILLCDGLCNFGLEGAKHQLSTVAILCIPKWHNGKSRCSVCNIIAKSEIWLLPEIVVGVE